jgi:hypothetical protein
MRLAECITEIGYDVDRTGIDDRIKFALQMAINTVYSALPKEERQRVAAISTVNGEQAVNAPTDFGDVMAVYNSDKELLTPLTPTEFFKKNKIAGSGTPLAYTVWNNQFLFSPIPNAAVNFTVNYILEHPNIYVHNLTINHIAATTGYVQVYIDEDGISTGEGKLLFVSPTSTDARVQLQTVDGHKHEIVVYHDAAAAANGVPWYFDESATNAYERNFFASPTKADTVIKTANYRKHHHYLNFIHNPAPTSFPDVNNKTVWIDEDAADRGLRLAGILVGAAAVANEVVHAPEGQMPGMLERYQAAVYELAVAKMHRFNKNYEWARQHSEAASGLMSLILGKPTLVAAQGGEQG